MREREQKERESVKCFGEKNRNKKRASHSESKKQKKHLFSLFSLGFSLSPLPLPDLGPPRRPRHEACFNGRDRPRGAAGLAPKEHDARARVPVEQGVRALAAVAEDVLVDVAAQGALEGLEGRVCCCGGGKKAGGK